MRDRLIAGILIVSVALNIILGILVYSGSWGNPLFSSGGPADTGAGESRSCSECQALIDLYRSRLNTAPFYNTSDANQSGKSAVLQGPAVMTTYDYIRQGRFVYERANQTGTMLSISSDVIPGQGRVLVHTDPLMGIVFQDAANTAVEIASNRTGRNLASSDVIFSIESGGVIPAVDGPSAGALMAILVESAITGKELNQSVTLTGTIDSFGRIGAIGGIVEKATAARDSGKILLLLPRENAVSTKLSERSRSIGSLRFVERVPVAVDTKELIEQSLGIRVEYVETIGDVERYLFT